MKKYGVLTFFLASALSTGAYAQSKTNAWEGAYGQVAVGFGIFTPSIGSGTANIPTGLPAPYPASINATTSAQSVNNINTALGNIAVGYNFGINSDYVLGIGASYYPGASSSANGSISATYNGATVASTSAIYNIKNLYNVFLSPGYVIDKDRLVYAKIGYTGATIALNGPTIPSLSVGLTGYNLGLGYKQMVSNSIYVLGEVNYASYGSKTGSTTSTTGVAMSIPVKGTRTDFLVGLGYRF